MLDEHWDELLDERNKLEKQNAALLEALKKAPPLPMKSNIDFWFDIYNNWRDDIRAKAITQAEGE